jgi:hypothetical protein
LTIIIKTCYKRKKGVRDKLNKTNVKYRVSYYESERGWGNDSWNTDYITEEEALIKVEETNLKFCSTVSTPDYYIRATYVGEVKV